ncbi:SDR family NAD(P)-dependent oxidoreductase [Priestia aryabhattai]|uniref:SDR family NAD(P)-dependent oxidoreductase n=1 Tax=Priestia aryabhattai TaxID=412384 RepID=UPI001C8EC0E4|nr:SDR family NAD(P)-dependent oxidoreductase [Priestia aryabhattai]MBY0061457.1 SDR family oxidoreductase [Priestia aryabhattai]
MGQLKGSVAYITGGSKGIGKAIAKTFSCEGAKACIVDLNEQGLYQTIEEFQMEGLDVTGLVCDVTKREQVESSMEEIVRTLGSIDILVNNAGLTRDNSFHKMTEDDWDLVMNVHLKGTYFCSQTAQKYMVQQQFGRIINISSVSALGNKGQANYATAKAGIQGFTKTLAIELGKFGITVNAIAPGFIETDMTKATAERLGLKFEELIEEKKKVIPMQRTGKPEDIANTALFFSLKESSFVNGQILYVAGGPKFE